MERQRCPLCGRAMSSNGKTSSGRRRWRCPACGSSSVRRIDSSAKRLEMFLGWLLSRRTQADKGCSRSTFKHLTSEFWEIWPIACDAVCPALAQRPKDEVAGVIWAKSTDGAERLASSSGGVFALLAHEVLNVGGVVVGAAWADGCRHARQVMVDSAEGLGSVMRSKYVQSSVGREVYEGVRGALRAGRRVLFSGTACQVAGMRAYPGRLADSDGFLAVDVICHGVPSPLLWERWAEHREGLAGALLRAMNMRSKTTGWLSFSAAYEYAAEKDGAPACDGSVFGADWFFKAFLSNASLRPSCFAYPAKRSCGSDVTLGDFWGIQSAHPEVDYGGGVSAVLCNTDKGVAAVEVLKSRLEWGYVFD